MYYGLFLRVGHTFVRVDTTTGFTYDTAKERFAHLKRILGEKAVLRKLPPVKQIDIRKADRRYAKSEI